MKVASTILFRRKLSVVLICPTREWMLGTTPSPLVAAVGSSLLVGTVVSRPLRAVVRGRHQRLFCWLIIKWRTDKLLSSDSSCGTESMRRLSGRINQRTSLCLQSFVASASETGRGGKHRIAPEKSVSLCGSGKKTPFTARRLRPC